MNTDTPPKNKKWTLRKILALVTAGIFITCCGLTSLVMMFDDTADPEPTVVALQGRAVEIPIEDEPAATSTLRPSPTPKPTSTTEPTAEPENTELPNETTAVVVDIIDGDTIDVEINGTVYRLRYIGIDTPERGDDFYTESTEANRQLVADQTVTLVKDVSETDRFGRLLRYVYLDDGTFVNAELVSTGYALAATYPPDVAHTEEFAQLQNQAQSNAVGLWAAAASEVAVVPTNTVSPPTTTPIPQPTNTIAPQPTVTQDIQPTAPPAPTATQLPPTEPSPPPTEPPPPAAAPGDVQLTFIFYDGLVSQVESDEYAVITQNGGSPVNIGGWRLNAGNPGQDFTFPGFDLQPGQSCRVYTNEYHPDTCGFSFGSGQAIWNNGGDCGYLFDNTGAQVSQRCY
ncbi:MAG: thermonuclease family protein [Ardenticatenaceae bacterium]|nr:thermonuclease family protein [Ardenticatenaceae bacterium]